MPIWRIFPRFLLLSSHLDDVVSGHLYSCDSGLTDLDDKDKVALSSVLLNLVILALTFANGLDPDQDIAGADLGFMKRGFIIFNGVGFRFADFISFFLNIP